MRSELNTYQGIGRSVPGIGRSVPGIGRSVPGIGRDGNVKKANGFGRSIGPTTVNSEVVLIVLSLLASGVGGAKPQGIGRPVSLIAPEDNGFGRAGFPQAPEDNGFGRPAHPWITQLV